MYLEIIIVSKFKFILFKLKRFINFKLSISSSNTSPEIITEYSFGILLYNSIVALSEPPIGLFNEYVKFHLVSLKPV